MRKRREQFKSRGAAEFSSGGKIASVSVVEHEGEAEEGGRHQVSREQRVFIAAERVSFQEQQIQGVRGEQVEVLLQEEPVAVSLVEKKLVRRKISPV